MSKIRKNNSARIFNKHPIIQKNDDDINYKNIKNNLNRNLDDITPPLKTNNDFPNKKTNYLQEKYSKINLENKKLKQEIFELNKKNKIITKEVQEQINIISNEKDNLRIEFNNIINDKNKIILSLNEEICGLKKNIEKLTNENIQLLNDLEELNEKLSKFKKEKQILVSEISDFNISLNNKIKPKLMEHEDYIVNLQDQINMLQNDNNNFLTNDIYQKCIINNLKREIQKLKSDKKVTSCYSNGKNTKEYNKHSFEESNFLNIITSIKNNTRNKNNKTRNGGNKENKSVWDILNKDKAIKIIKSINSEKKLNDGSNLNRRKKGNSISGNHDKENDKSYMPNIKKNKINYRNILFDENKSNNDFKNKKEKNFSYQLKKSNKKKNGCSQHKTTDDCSKKEFNFSKSRSQLSSYDEDLINLDE